MRHEPWSKDEPTQAWKDPSVRVRSIHGVLLTSSKKPLQSSLVYSAERILYKRGYVLSHTELKLAESFWAMRHGVANDLQTGCSMMLLELDWQAETQQESSWEIDHEQNAKCPPQDATSEPGCHTNNNEHDADLSKWNPANESNEYKPKSMQIKF